MSNQHKAVRNFQGLTFLFETLLKKDMLPFGTNLMKDPTGVETGRNGAPSDLDGGTGLR